MNGTRPVLPVPGVHLGHWTDEEACTGCSVLLFDRSVLAAVEVRGAAPGSRELETLAPGAIGQRVDALLFSGGSAFGLAAADGVMRFLRERHRGFPTAAGPVSIVPAAVIYDLAVGKAEAPDLGSGYEACRAAVPLADARFGAVGAGIGARFGAVRGRERVRSGGVGVGQYTSPDGVVTAIAVLNAFGTFWAGDSDAEEDPRLGYLRRGAPRTRPLSPAPTPR